MNTLNILQNIIVTIWIIAFFCGFYIVAIAIIGSIKNDAILKKSIKIYKKANKELNKNFIGCNRFQIGHWINVKDEAPPLMEVSLGWSKGYPKNPEPHYCLFCPLTENTYHITHWLSLPEKPDLYL